MVTSAPSTGSLKRTLLIALVLFGLVLTALAITAWTAEPEEPLPFEYDGF